MRIMLVSASLRGGGAERVQITLAGALRELGHTVTLVSIEDDLQLAGHVPEDVRLLRLGARRVWRGIPRLAVGLRRENPDAVIAAMVHVGSATLIAARMARWHGKIVVRADGLLSHALRHASRWQRFVLGPVQRWLLPSAHAVVGVSSQVAEEYREMLGLANCHVIHNPVARVAAREWPRPEQEAYRSGLPVVVAAGRLDQVKGFEFLLDGFAELRKTVDARLVILGEGPLRRELDRRVSELGLKDAVGLPGFVEDVHPYLHHASVCVVPSVSEAFGLVLVEAMAHGTPVVATATAGPREILCGGSLGRLINPNDISGLASALGAAIDDPDWQWEQRIQRAEDFRPDRIALAYLRLISPGGAPAPSDSEGQPV